MKSNTNRRTTSSRPNSDQPVHSSHSHMSRYGGWWRSARVRTLYRIDQDDEQDQRRDPGRREQVGERVGG